MSRIINQKEMLSLFSYDTESGLLTAKVKRSGSKLDIGDAVGSLHECGPSSTKKYYLRMQVDGNSLYIHRIIWVMMTGKQPLTIDHLDGNGLNNKWVNLRSVSHRINTKNQLMHKTNTSGVSGVCFRKDSNKWRARIMVDDKPINLGTFKAKEDAIEARLEAEKKYNFYGT